MLDKLWEFLINSLEALVPFTVVQPYQRAIVIHLGVVSRELEPGFHWIYPFHIDYVMKENVVPRTESIAGLATTTSDGRSVGFEAVVTYRIVNIRKALTEVEDLKDAVADACAGQIGTTLTDSTWEEIQHGKALDKVSAACRKRGWKWGVEIMEVQLKGVSITRNLRLMLSGHGHQTHNWSMG